MTKTKKQLRAEAVERLKNCVAARFDADSIVIALTSGRHGQSDWSLECDKLIYLLTDDDSTTQEDDSTAERGMTNKEWLDYLAQNAPDELSAWFDEEHVETEERALDGDTAALNARIAELTAERDKLQEQLLIGWECECRLQAEREHYRDLFGKCLDYADAIHALMDDEGMA